MQSIKILQSNRVFAAVYTQDVSAYDPKFWANESLAILEENMVMGNLVHRDFEPIIARFGDTVNTRRPGEFVAKRKTATDDVTVQDATATNVQVPLNQHIHVSFMIRDGEESISMKDLVAEYMAPAMLAQARIVDQILLGQCYQFLANAYGGINKLTTSNVVDYVTGIRNVQNQKKAYVDGRNLILTPNSETTFLNTTQFTDANRVGDDGTALREASLGRKFGYDIFMCQNASSIAAGNTAKTGAVNLSAGYAVGTTVLTVNTFTNAVATSSWCFIDGDDTPQQITAHTETLSATTSITISPGLRKAVVNTAAITVLTPGAVNFSAGYAAGWSKEIVVNTFSVAPQVGQSVTFAAQTAKYTIIQVNALIGITLDRPLDAAIANSDAVNILPRGEYNFAFHRNALALVCRPLAQPRPGIGATSAVVNLNGLSVRATISYNGTKQGTLVTLDCLLGVAILDTNLGGVLLG